MSQVDEFHSHMWMGTPIPIPGPVRHCDDPQCATERAIITQLSTWPDSALQREFEKHQKWLTAEMTAIERTREAINMKQESI